VRRTGFSRRYYFNPGERALIHVTGHPGLSRAPGHWVALTAPEALAGAVEELR